MKFLKTEHNVTQGFTNTIVALFKEQNAPQEDLVLSQLYKWSRILSLNKDMVDSRLIRFANQDFEVENIPLMQTGKSDIMNGSKF